MITSANTSVNKNRLPALYNKVNFHILSDGYRIEVIDYGCGKYDNSKKFIESFGSGWNGYDPYNRTEEENTKTKGIMTMMKHGFVSGCILCSNVLCVIDNDSEVQRIADMISSCNVPYFITVYEGDKTGQGRITKEDCYQRNEPLKAYLQYFPGAVIKHGVITNHPEYIK